MKSFIRCDGRNVYIYNGKDSTYIYNQDPPDDLSLFLTKPEFRGIWVYNLAIQQWRLMKTDGNLPDEYDLIFGTIFESNYLVIWTIGIPFNNELSRRRDRLHICDLNTESVHVRETSGRIPNPSFAFNLIRHGKYLYTVGIVRGRELFSDLHKLNIDNGIWEVVYSCQGLDANEPLGRSGHTLVYGNDMIYIFGGASDEAVLDEFSFVKISAFDLEKCCWKIVYTHGDENYTPHYPEEREDFGIMSYPDPDSGEINVMISGGRVDHYDAVNGVSVDDFNDVWRLNLTSLKWTCLERVGTVLPFYLENHSMAISPAGQLFLFGGCIIDNDIEEPICSSILHSTWLRIPNLIDICWEAVFHYYPNLKSMADIELKSLGIPPKLLKSRIY